MLLKRLVEASPQLESVVPSLLAAFDRAVSAGEPRHCALICLDQAPSHYLRAQGGGISAMIDIEGHLWAPVEYELAIVSLWMRPFETVKAAYEEHVAWPSAFDEVSDVYRNFTWMQWIYCMRFLTPNPTVVEGLEKQLMQMCS
jgi:hypothetical protein